MRVHVALRLCRACVSFAAHMVDRLGMSGRNGCCESACGSGSRVVVVSGHSYIVSSQAHVFSLLFLFYCKPTVTINAISIYSQRHDGNGVHSLPTPHWQRRPFCPLLPLLTPSFLCSLRPSFARSPSHCSALLSYLLHSAPLFPAPQPFSAAKGTTASPARTRPTAGGARRRETRSRRRRPRASAKRARRGAAGGTSRRRPKTTTQRWTSAGRSRSLGRAPCGEDDGTLSREG